jgi:hypothetical protein
MLKLDCSEGDTRPMVFGFVARSKVNVVVNRKLEVIRVPIRLHQMSIRTQRDWCRRNRVDFIRPCRKKLTKTAIELVA